MNDNKFYKLHIFSAGTHKSASGHTCTLTQDDLSNTADVFISNHRVPLCLGHSSYKKKDVLPSMGWFRAVKEEDGQLYGLLEATNAGKALIDGGYYENFSASFYAPDSPLNPKPGTWTLRHVAALGEEPPALKELDPMLEIIPEDFSEVQDFNRFYEFKNADAGDFEEFSDDTSLLPDTFDFKTFRKFGGKLNCKPGFKQCGGRCIPNKHKCKVGQSKKFTPGTRKDYKKPQNKTTSIVKTPFKPKEEWQKEKDAEKKAAKDKQTKKNLTTGLLKGVGAAAILLTADHMERSTFPDNKQAKAASKIISSLLANQLILKDDASISDRMKAAAYGGLKGGLNFGIESALGDNPAAKSMATATTAMFEQVLGKSGLIEMDSYDKFAKGLMDATETFGKAIRDVRNFEKPDGYKKSEYDDVIDEMKKTVDTYKNEDRRAYKDLQDRMDRMEQNQRRQYSSKDNLDQKFGVADKRLEEILKLMKEYADGGADHEGLMKKIAALQDEWNNYQMRDYSEADVARTSKSYGKTGHLYYPNSDVKITFTRPEALAAIAPFLLSLALELGIINRKDIDKAYAKPAKAGNPQLDAIFSELDTAKSVIRHETENESLFRALFGDNRLVKQSEIDGIDRAFSEESGTERESMGQNRRRRRRRNSNSFSEKSNKRTNRSSGKNSLSIDSLISDAIATAESTVAKNSEGERDFAENNRGNRKRGRGNPKKQNPITRNFAEGKTRRRKRVRMMDFSEQQPRDTAESQELKRLRKELAQEKLRGRRLEVENFAESLYDSGKLTNGFARKKDLIEFLMKQDNSSGSFDFGEGSTSGTNEYDFVVNLLSNIEPMVSFSEVVEDNTMVPMPKFEEGYDLQSQKLDYQINLMMQANPELTYNDAWAKVAGGTLR